MIGYKQSFSNSAKAQNKERKDAMFKKPQEIDDAFEISFVTKATLANGKEIEVTIERRRRCFFVDGHPAVIFRRPGTEIALVSEDGQWIVSDPEGLRLKQLHRGWCLPEHGICKQNVESPTIRVVELDEEEKSPLVYIQWFGVVQEELMPEACMPDGSQFLFPMGGGIGPGAEIFKGKPESFRVVFLGQAKDWPEPKAVQAIINGPGRGNINAWFVWLVSSEVMCGRGGKPQPASPLFSPDLLSDPNCGIIAPRCFSDLSIRDRIMEEFSSAI